MTTEFFKKLESEVTCPLCLGVFVEPKKLPCEHVYCRACLQGLALRSTNKAISCPECRRDEPIPDDNSVAHFTTPYRVNRQLEMYQDILKSTEKAATSPKLTTCSTHNSQPLDMYCETCEKLVCTHCVILSCTKKNHNHGFIDEMVKLYESDLGKKLQPAKTLHRNIATALEAISTSERELQGAKEAKLLEIQTSFDALIEILAKEKLYFMGTLEKSFQEQECLFLAKRKELSESLDNLEFVLQSTESSLHSQSKTAFLSGIGDLKNRIEQSVNVASDVSFSLNPPEILPEMEYELLRLEEFRELCHTKNFVYMKSDPLKCHMGRSVNLNDIPIYQPFTVTLHLNSSNVNKGIFGKFNITAQILSILNGSSQAVTVKKGNSEIYSLTFEPHQSGKHELQIKYLDSVTCRIPICVIMKPGMLFSKKVDGATGIKYYKGNVYTSLDRHAIAVLDPSSLNRKKVINTPGGGELLIDSPHIYVTDIVDCRVIKMDMKGSVVASTGSRGNGPKKFDFPNGIRLSKNNEIFVCDSNNHRIQVFDKDLNFIRILGKYGHDKGHFNWPADLDFDEDGNIYVADMKNHRIQVLTSWGEHIRYIGARGHVIHPCSPAIHGGLIYVTDVANKCISVFKTTGEFVTTFGEGKLFNLDCIAIDDDGFVFVTDSRSHVKKFYIPI